MNVEQGVFPREDLTDMKILTTEGFDDISDFLNSCQEMDLVISVILNKIWDSYPEIVYEIWHDRMAGMEFESISEMAEFMADNAGYMIERRYPH